ncbi:MAG: oligoendopeptidase F [Bacilli bacterium]
MVEKQKKLPKRSEVKVEDTWRLEDIFATDEDWQKQYETVASIIVQLSNGQGTLGNSAMTLLTVLKKRDEIYESIGKLYTYAHMRSDQDASNAFYQGMNSKARTLYSQAASHSAWFVPELLTLSDVDLQRYFEENEQLRLYKQAISEIVREREHYLSKNEEEILALAANPLSASSSTFSMLNNAEIKFPSITDADGEEIQVTHGRYMTLLENKDRNVRKAAFDSMYSTYGQYKNTLAATLTGAVKKDNFYAKVRKYKNARECALSENDIPEVVYDQLIEAIHEHLPLLHRYVALRKQVMGLEELRMYDLYTPLVPEVEMKVTYEEAKNHLLEGLAPLGEDYIEILKEAFENRWVDVYENEGKRSGAYSSGTYGTNPYILMNWQNNVDNLFTLAHEFGHSVHSYLTRSNQPYVYGDYSIFVAEVASTTNEAILNDYLLKRTKSKQERMYLLNHFLEAFRATVFRQTMFAEFEHLIHEKDQAGEPLTAEALSAWYHELNVKYYGPSIVVDEEVGIEWARIPHFYYNYYVFQYATGFSAAMALSKRILEEGDEAVQQYKEFLSAGCSAAPLDVLRHAGVDMTTETPIVEAMKIFEQYVDELEQLLQEK